MGPAKQQTEKLWFSAVIDGVFIKGLGKKVDDQLKQDLAKLGLKLDKLDPAYPIEVVQKSFELVHQRLFPDLTREQAYFELGVSSMRGYGETLLGKALVRVLALIGIRRSILRMNISMRSGNNFLHTEANVVSDTSVELIFNDVSGMPTFYQGIIEEGGRMAHSSGVRTRALDAPAPGARFLVEWTP